MTFLDRKTCTDMKTYVYNDDPRVNQDVPYKSFKDVQGSEEWKNDSAKYCYVNHIPSYCEGFSHYVHAFDDINELFDKVSGDRKDFLLKVIKYDDYTDAFVMEFRNEPRETLDDEARKYLQEHLGERSDQYNCWWVLGFVRHKDGSPITKEECIEREL